MLKKPKPSSQRYHKHMLFYLMIPKEQIMITLLQHLFRNKRIIRILNKELTHINGLIHSLIHNLAISQKITFTTKDLKKVILRFLFLNLFQTLIPSNPLTISTFSLEDLLLKWLKKSLRMHFIKIYIPSNKLITHPIMKISFSYNGYKVCNNQDHINQKIQL